MNPLSFGCRYLDRIKVQNALTGKKETMRFVEYEKGDKKDAKKLENIADNWNRVSKTTFAPAIYHDYALQNNKARIYGLEDQYGNIQAICEINSGKNNTLGYFSEEFLDKDCFELTFLNVNPNNINKKGFKEYLNLGKKMFSKVIEQARKGKYKKIILENANDIFWRKVPYLEDYEYGFIKILNDDNFIKCKKALE